MLAFHSVKARHDAGCCRGGSQALRAVTFCRNGMPISTWFAIFLLVLMGILTAARGYSQTNFSSLLSSEHFDNELDSDGNGIEDVLDSWIKGESFWADLRQVARNAQEVEEVGFPGRVAPSGGPWQDGQLRLICLGSVAADLAQATFEAQKMGQVKIIHDLDVFGGVTVLVGDSPGLRAFLAAAPPGRIILDRDGTPALDQSRISTGQDQVIHGQWPLGNDWSGTVAILDSGCDTAHDDLGDPTMDNVDGPAPEVGDASDWYDAVDGWPLSSSYKVMGWQDVTDDFPQAVGPWDYHHHGTALASVIAGRGIADTRYGGMSPFGRLTVVKFYDFDQVWHAWLGDFLAACAWTLENREIYRIRTVLIASNWDVDGGISNAMAAFVDVGILPVVAMGNDGPESSGPGYPAALPGVLTVGSMDRNGAVSWHSGRGIPGQDKPDLIAPGGGQSFTSWIVTADNEPNDEYSGRQGTSIAAAHVAGAAFLLQEAFQDRGVPAVHSREGVLDQIALLKATTTRVVSAENITGDGVFALPVTEDPLSSRGWGGLRIDAAVEAFSRPLIAGLDLTDTLSFDNSHPVVACKLNLGDGIRYLVEAVPGPGLDVSLDIINPRWLDSATTWDQIQRNNDNGSGTSEFGYVTGDREGWFLAVVKRVSGEGEVQLRLREADTFTTMSSIVTLPGIATAAPCVADGPNPNESLIVATSRVSLDLGARAISIFAATGEWYPQWPVYVFPGTSAHGGLNMPLTWDLDGNPGDEIVVTSDFGTIYFFTLAGDMQAENLGFNNPLTNPVGVINGAGERQVVTVDGQGVLSSWSWGPTLEIEKSLGIIDPLAPAVGQVLSVGGQEIVVSFLGGQIVLLDALGNAQAGWPVDLGVELKEAPVLLDLDDDGDHEIIQVHFDETSGILQYHIFNGQGEYFFENPVTVPAPDGGKWLKVSNPVVAGRYGAGNLRVVVTGLTDNQLPGSQKKWHLYNAAVNFENNVVIYPLTNFEVDAISNEGDLSLNNSIFATPLTNDINCSGGGDPMALLAISWVEDLYGLTAMPGAFTGRIVEKSDTMTMEARRPLDVVAHLEIPSYLAAAQAPLVPGIQLEVTAIDDQLRLIAWPLDNFGAPVWLQERCDKLNSGAYPLRDEIVSVPEYHAAQDKLLVYPNPGGGEFKFSWPGDKSEGNLNVRIFDLKGRHLRTLSAEGSSGLVGWDGCDENGRPLGAGVYLAVGKILHRTAISRVVLMR